MNILIIYAHPSKQSFTFQVFESLKKGLLKSGHSIEISDLYAMNFQTDLSESEYNREGFGQLNLPIPEDVKTEQEKLERADCVIFVYPVWWSDCPAKMKGWFDRVYTVGYAYGYDDSKAKSSKMKTINSGIVLCPAGHSNDFLEEIGIAESMRKVMLEDRLGKRFLNKEMFILGGTIDLKKVEEKHLNFAFQFGKELETYF